MDQRGYRMAACDQSGADFPAHEPCGPGNQNACYFEDPLREEVRFLGELGYGASDEIHP